MKIALSTWSFYPLTSTGKMTVLETVAKTHELGFSAIEFVDLPGNTLDEQKELAKQLRAEADKYGMTINAYVIGAILYHDNEEDSRKEVERICGQLEIAKILGCPVMRHDVCYGLGKGQSGRSFDLMLPTIVKNITAITEYGQKLGIKTCAENHGYVANDSDRVERMFNAVNHPNFGLLADMGNFLVVDENNLSAMSRVAPYAIHAHVKDMNISAEPIEEYHPTRGCNYFQGAVLGTGVVNVKKCLTILKRAKYNGYITLEYEAPGDIFDGVTRSREYLVKALEELEIYEG